MSRVKRESTHMKYFILILLVFAFAKVQADSPAMPTPRVTASSGGNTYFAMIPERYHYEGNDRIQDRPAFGRAYKLDRFGEPIELWEVSGWFAHLISYLFGKHSTIDLSYLLSI